MIMTTVENIMYHYLAIGFAKSMLALAEVHVAAYTAHRVTGKPVWLLMLGLAFGLLLTTLLIWPRSLKEEGWRFFLTYSRFSVMRQVLAAYREADKQSTEKRFI
jgi:low temperature requirement protein LtrA